MNSEHVIKKEPIPMPKPKPKEFTINYESKKGDNIVLESFVNCVLNS